MPKPDYAHWGAQPEYSLSDAAWLCCDLEPETPTREKPLPRRVSAMYARLDKEVSHTPSERKTFHQGWLNGEVHTRTQRITPYVRRDNLRQWAERTGQRGAMPFLFPEDRDTGEDLETESLRVDTKEGYLFLIGLLVHTIADMGGPAMKTPKGPNKTGILERLGRTARSLGVAMDGLGKSQGNEKLSAALTEIENRKRDQNPRT